MYKRIVWAGRSYFQIILFWLALGWLALLFIDTRAIADDVKPVALVIGVLLALFPAVVFSLVFRRQMDWCAARFYPGFVAPHLAAWAAFMFLLGVFVAAVNWKGLADPGAAATVTGLGLMLGTVMAGASWPANMGILILAVSGLAWWGSEGWPLAAWPAGTVAVALMVEAAVTAGVVARLCKVTGRHPVRNADAFELSRQERPSKSPLLLFWKDRQMEKFLALPAGGKRWRKRRDRLTGPMSMAGFAAAMVASIMLCVVTIMALTQTDRANFLQKTIGFLPPAMLLTGWMTILLPWHFLRNRRAVIGHELLRPVDRRIYLRRSVGTSIRSSGQGVLFLALVVLITMVLFRLDQLWYQWQYDLATNNSYIHHGGASFTAFIRALWYVLCEIAAWPVQNPREFLLNPIYFLLVALLLPWAMGLRLAWVRSNLLWGVCVMPAGLVAMVAAGISLNYLQQLGYNGRYNNPSSIPIFLAYPLALAVVLVLATWLIYTGWRAWRRQEFS